MPGLLTLSQAAEKLNVPIYQLRSLLRSGSLPFIEFGPRTRRINPDDLASFIQTSTNNKGTPHAHRTR